MSCTPTAVQRYSLKQDPPILDISSPVLHTSLVLSWPVATHTSLKGQEHAEVKEGFLCPLCLKDLQSFYQLQDHYGEEHSGEDLSVLKSLVQKAKKAKDKLLKWNSEDRPDTHRYLCGGVDPYMWDPQELGATRNHLDFFKKHRAARAEHNIIEVNKLITNLKTLTSIDHTNFCAAKIRAMEKSVVPWVSDSDVPFCPDCGHKFRILSRRHHCRLCGFIMCWRCMEFLTLFLAYEIISGTPEALCVPGSPGQSQVPTAGGGGGMFPRRNSISSLSSVTSMLEEKDDERIRSCRHCMDTLLKRQQKLEKDRMPDIVTLYERLRLCMDKVDERAAEYIRMTKSLNAGETAYNLDTAGGLRMEVLKYHELIDALSKRILTLGMNDDPPPHPTTLQLQKMVRYTVTLFVKEKLFGLRSLPTKETYENLKEKRKQEQEKKRQESEKNRHAANTNRALPRAPAALCMSSSDSFHTQSEFKDHLLQQIENIQSFLRQAQEAHQMDEVVMLNNNLKQLQDEYDQQETSLAITLFKKLDKESLQQDEIEHLEAQEMEHMAPTLSILWENSLDLGHAGNIQQEEYEEPADKLTPKAENSPLYLKVSPTFMAQEMPQRLRSLSGHVTPLGGEEQNFNSFNEDSTPIKEDIQKAHQATNGKEYNPFEEKDNPFEEKSNASSPFTEAWISIKPFNRTDEEVLQDMDVIKEELLLQQIDKIRAYIFDAKRSDRMDEVELLLENLRELQYTLLEQKKKMLTPGSHNNLT